MSETTTTKPELTLLKVQLAEMKGGHGLNVTYLETMPNKKPKKITLESPNYASKDCVNAILSFAHHFAVRTFYVSAADVPNPSRPDRAQFKAFHVHGFSLDEQGKKPYIIISGHVEQEGSSPCNTHTPITYLKKDGEKVYAMVDDLLERIEKAKARVFAYIREEELGEDPQLDMFEEPKKKATKAQIAEPLPKNNGKLGKVSTKGQQPAESVPTSDDRGSTVKMAAADPEAQKRVAAETNEQLNGGAKRATPNRKRAQQTSENPGGDPVDEEGGA